jgi:hypothetical protein
MLTFRRAKQPAQRPTPIINAEDNNRTHEYSRPWHCTSWSDPSLPHVAAAAGGRGIIDGLEKEMQLSRRQVEPSRASLYRFGNTSSTR